MRSSCPSCDAELIAKCGHIVSWHWAHIAADCDPWSEPESEWHIGWKDRFEAAGATVEVVMGEHRADVVTPDGGIVELQGGYLPAEDIVQREAFYGPTLTWIYRCHWRDRLQFGRYGFWWRNGAKSMTLHQQPLWWHVGDELWNVRLSLITRDDDSERVLGKVVEKRSDVIELRVPQPTQMTLGVA
jgi:hypothetical protein